MNKSIAVLSTILMVTLLSLQMVLAIESSTNSTTNASQATQVSAAKASTTLKEAIPGGTKKFVSKHTMQKKMMQGTIGDFPYDMTEAIAWVRAHKISLPDPTTKKSLLINILSDDQIASYLLKPAGLKLSGVEDAGLSKSKSSVTVVQNTKRPGFGFSSHREDVSKELLGPGQSGKKELPYYMVSKTSSSEIPQNGNINEEYVWLRNNLQSVYDPFKKNQISVSRSSEEYLRYLLKSPSVRKNLGLAALPDNSFKKSARFT